MFAASMPGPLFTKRMDVLPHYLVKSLSRDIRVYNFPIPLKFDRKLHSSAIETPIKFCGDTIIITSNFAASKRYKISR